MPDDRQKKWTDLRGAGQGNIPADALPYGQEGDGPLYVARAFAPDGSLQPGKLGKGWGQASIPFGGDELWMAEFDVLTKGSGAHGVVEGASAYFFPVWDAAPAENAPFTYAAEQGETGLVPPCYTPLLGGGLGDFPPGTGGIGPEFGAVKCGQEADGTPLFSALVNCHGGFHPGKVRLGLASPGANVSYGGDELTGQQPYTTLCDMSYCWTDGQPNGPAVPGNAVQCGTDDDGTPLFLGRTMQPGQGLQVGKVRGDCWSTPDGMRYPFAGAEQWASNYQVLGLTAAGESATWQAASNGHIPDGAVSVGFENDGTPIFAARAFYNGGQHCGKVRHGFQGAYIPWSGKEVAVLDYEVLVAPDTPGLL